MTWTADALATTTRLWGEGYSATEIAKAVKARHGMSVTRSAVLGKLHRLKVAKRGRTAHTTRAQRRDHSWRRPTQARVTKKVAAMIQPIDPAPSLSVPLEDLQFNQCHAVTDATRWAQRYCGQPVAFGCSYCSAHFQRYRIINAKKGKAQ